MPITEGKDLAPADFDGLSWEAAHAADSLVQIYRHVTVEASSAIDWYLRAKRPKQKAARWIRGLAILAGVVAGIIPIMSQMFLRDGHPYIPPGWASLALAAAAAFVAFDRFFGFSSGWMRFLIAEMKIRRVLQSFQMDWEAERATWKGAPPNAEQVQGMLARAKAFLVEVIGIVEAETSAWAEEFQSTLKQIDEAAKTKAELTALAGINVTVTNGETCDQGWQLSVDGGARLTYSGRSAAVSDVVPGSRRIKVESTIGGKPKQAEKLVTVAAGGIAQVELTLA